MGKFRRLLQDLELIEIHLQGRLFTWSNERQAPMLERIDHAFISLDWADRFPNHGMRALSMQASDHAPLLLTTDSESLVKKCFHFETIWTRFPWFLQAVQEGWVCPLQNADIFRTLDYKFRNTAEVLKQWSQKFVGNINIQLAVAKEIVLGLIERRSKECCQPKSTSCARSLNLNALA